MLTLAAASTPASPPSAQPSDPPTMPLGRFLDQVAAAIRGGVPAALWVEATVIAAKAGTYGHQLELVDPGSKTSRSPPQLRAFLAISDRKAIAAKLEMDFDPISLVGMTATLLIRPDFHPKYHLQARIADLSQSLRQSLLTQAVEQIRERLRRENLYDRQRQLRAPVAVTRIAVIHPAGAAGWADISAVLARWQAAGIIAVRSIEASFEGPRVSTDLSAALAQAQRSDPSTTAVVDIVIMVRGGGDRAGLQALQNEAVARAICLCPIPVITGLGHAIDRSLLDEVAWMQADTPSKVLPILQSLILDPARRAIHDIATIETCAFDRLDRTSLDLDVTRDHLLAEAERRLERAILSLTRCWAQVGSAASTAGERCGRLQDGAARLLAIVLDSAPRRLDEAEFAASRTITSAIERARRALEASGIRDDQLQTLVMRALAHLDSQQVGVDRALENTVLGALRAVTDAASDLARLQATLDGLDLQATLARGYALVTDATGRLLPTRSLAVQHDPLLIHFVDGVVAVRADFTLTTEKEEA